LIAKVTMPEFIEYLGKQTQKDHSISEKTTTKKVYGHQKEIFEIE